jgi:N-acetylglucosaminyldiphosphoundecaprenol N-acetyl-beta-D-mannosaminyltransferase
MDKKLKILGVRFDNISFEEATKRALKFAVDTKQHYITTPNPEILLEAQRNNKFLKVLNRSDLNVADGIGILWAAKYLKEPLQERVTGTDLVQSIAKEASKDEKQKIFMLGAAPGIAKKAAKILTEKHPNLKIVGTHAGSPKPKHEKEIIRLINKSQANIIFVAYGAPAQEFWITRNLKKMPKVKLAIGIGGAFDFIAGKRKRAPKLFQSLGLEWLYRLIQEPARLKRIFNATVKFPLKVLKKGR